MTGTASRRLLDALLLVAAACGGGREAAPPATPRRAGPVWFVERIAGSGVDFIHDAGASAELLLPEIMGSGVCLLDYDRDGRLDLYFVQSGSYRAAPSPRGADRLYRNLGGLRFADVTADSRTGDQGYGMGCAVGDVDADGWPDLYVTNVGANALYRNRGGIFERSPAGVEEVGWGTSALFFDYDLDDRLDLAVTNYLEWAPERELECYQGGRRDYCLPGNYRAPAVALLYRNLGQGRFAEVGRRLGLTAAFGPGLGLAAADLLGDPRPELYVANDGTANQLWVQTEHGFEDQAVPLGAAVNRLGAAEASMGVAAADPDGDGDLDLFLTHLDTETNTFYRNGGELFSDATAELGLAAPSRGRTGFGVGFADFDHDGWLDVYVANGRVSLAAEPLAADPYAEANQLLAGLPSGRFAEVPDGATAEAEIATSRGAAFGDLDNDGDVDIVVSNRNGRPHLLENVRGGDGTWVMFRLLDGARDALGARLGLEAGGRSWWRWTGVASSYCSANDPRVHIGLGAAASVDRVRVTWPGGAQEVFGPFPVGAVHELRRGSGRVESRG
ncbi:MAG: CRTAC1 family protein [Thermoanaerobaculia bacterium]